MPTDQETLDYFKSVAFLQRRLLQDGWAIIRGVNDKGMIDRLETIVRDEVKHYAAVNDILETMLLKDDGQRRKFFRENWLGEVKVKRLSDGQDFAGHSVNLSQGGMCIEAEEGLSEGDELELKFVPYGKKEENYFQGRVVWMNRVNQERYLLGVEFKTEAKDA